MNSQYTKAEENNAKLESYLSPLTVWALSFGCAVGWGAFVMPGTTFLPTAGPIGTVLGVAAGALVMFIIGINYCYLMEKYPGSGGTLTYTVKSFGYDHGFLSAWFLVLVYVAIIWANATALSLICRNLFGSTFQFGFHYEVLGYDIWMGEIMLSAAVILVFGLMCIFGKKLAVQLQVLLALLLLLGIAVCAFNVIAGQEGTFGYTGPSFSPKSDDIPGQVFIIIALSPWAFVGFESVSNSAASFKFPIRKAIRIIALSLVCSAFAYIFLALTAASALPEGYEDWNEYISDIGNLDGIAGLPTFFAVSTVMGQQGVVILGIAATAAILTGVMGNFIAASRLICSMSEESMLPGWFGRIGRRGTPKNALAFIIFISLLVLFLGRVAIGWIVDVTTVGAAIAYGYTSAAAFVNAGKENNIKIRITGIAGLVLSAAFFFYFMALSSGAMATESYLIFAFWSILGFVYFRYTFGRDRERRFGKSTVVWIGLLFIIFFTSLMWIKQATGDMTSAVIGNVSDYYGEKYAGKMDLVIEAENFVAEQLRELDSVQFRNIMIQMALIIISLAIMFSIYSIMSRREKFMEVEKAKAEENSRAKSTFLSNMSHDIRTPMNAIIGYVNLAEKEGNDREKLEEYIGKIKNSSQHLLALINDVLEMSRIESGKMELEPAAGDLKKTLNDVYDMFSVQMREKGIDFSLDTTGTKNGRAVYDESRLNRVLLNLISNAYKFTQKGGSVKVTLRQEEEGGTDEEYGSYELSVADTGIGMTPEFAERVFDAFERERKASVSNIQGTGLGMAITKNIVDLMGGTIDVITAPDEGTEFRIHLRFKLWNRDELSDEESAAGAEEKAAEYDFTGIRVLVADSLEINREITGELLKRAGASVEEAEDGKIAAEMVSASEPGYYSAVLMDIQMPVMDGYAATGEIRSLSDPELANIPVIALTAHAFSEDVKRAEEAGMNDHIAKPVDEGELYFKLSEALGGRGRVTGSSAKEQSLEGKRVLLAEDVEINAEVMKEILSMRGIETDHAENGRIAADMFADSPVNYYDAVLMDMQMPVMNGLDATAEIRSSGREDAGSIPVIAVTGDSSSEDIKQAMETGMNAYLSKPIDPELLFETLEKLIIVYRGEGSDGKA